MATPLAIAGACEAVIRLLRSSYDPTQFNQGALDFQVYVADNFTNPMDQGVSLLLYRIYHNGTARTPPGRLLRGVAPRRRVCFLDLTPRPG